VNDYDSEQRPGAQEEERGVGTKQGRVRELKNRPRNSHDQWCLRMGHAKFVKMMEVCGSEDQGREEDDGLSGAPRHE